MTIEYTCEELNGDGVVINASARFGGERRPGLGVVLPWQIAMPTEIDLSKKSNPYPTGLSVAALLKRRAAQHRYTIEEQFVFIRDLFVPSDADQLETEGVKIAASSIDFIRECVVWGERNAQCGETPYIQVLDLDMLASYAQRSTTASKHTGLDVVDPQFLALHELNALSGYAENMIFGDDDPRYQQLLEASAWLTDMMFGGVLGGEGPQQDPPPLLA